MPQGMYQVKDVESSMQQPPQGGYDNSYKMCIITMGVFLVICVILLLCTLPFQSNQPESSDGHSIDSLKGNEASRTTEVTQHQIGNEAEEEEIDELPHTQNTNSKHKKKTGGHAPEEEETVTKEQNQAPVPKDTDKGDETGAAPTIKNEPEEADNADNSGVQSGTSGQQNKTSSETDSAVVLPNLSEAEKESSNNIDDESGAAPPVRSEPEEVGDANNSGAESGAPGHQNKTDDESGAAPPVRSEPEEVGDANNSDAESGAPGHQNKTVSENDSVVHSHIAEEEKESNNPTVSEGNAQDDESGAAPPVRSEPEEAADANNSGAESGAPGHQNKTDDESGAAPPVRSEPEEAADANNSGAESGAPGHQNKTHDEAGDAPIIMNEPEETGNADNSDAQSGSSGHQKKIASETDSVLVHEEEKEISNHTNDETGAAPTVIKEPEEDNNADISGIQNSASEHQNETANESDSVAIQPHISEEEKERSNHTASEGKDEETGAAPTVRKEPEEDNNADKSGTQNTASEHQNETANESDSVAIQPHVSEEEKERSNHTASEGKLDESNVAPTVKSELDEDDNTDKSDTQSSASDNQNRTSTETDAAGVHPHVPEEEKENNNKTAIEGNAEGNESGAVPTKRSEIEEAGNNGNSDTQTDTTGHQNKTVSETDSAAVQVSEEEEKKDIEENEPKEENKTSESIDTISNNKTTSDESINETEGENPALKNDVEERSVNNKNTEIKNDTHAPMVITESRENRTVKIAALNSTDNKESLQIGDTPICIAPSSTANATERKSCLSSTCKNQAKHLMMTMSFNVHACDDFYEFACGDLRRDKSIQPENLEQDAWDRIKRSMQNDSSIAADKFKRFYNQCVTYDSVPKEERIKQAGEILHEVGTFYNKTSWDASPVALTQLLLNMFQLHSAPLFDVLLDVDKIEATRFTFQIIPPLSQSLFQDVLEEEIHCRQDILHTYQNRKTFLLNDAYEEYRNCTLYPGDFLQRIVTALEKFSAFNNLNEAENTSIVRLKQAIEFSILPCKNGLPNNREMLQNLLAKEFHTITVTELNSAYPLIQWEVLLKGLLGDRDIPPELTIQLYFKGYFDELFHNLETVEKYELHNAVLALFAHDLYFNLVETKSACDRPSYCLKIASTLMQDVSSVLYLSSFTKDQQTNFHKELQEISEQIIKVSKQIVAEQDTLMEAQIKLERMKIITDGGINIYETVGFMESLLTDIEIDDSDGYLINAIHLIKHYRKEMYRLFLKDPRSPESIWSHFLQPYNIEPISIYPLNMVVVPYGYVGALQSYDPLKGYMRKIRLALPIARHILHHLDTTGKSFNVSSLSYDDFEYCLDIYSTERSWKHPDTKQIMNFKVQASLFHNQRFTDFLALRTVLEAYRTEINAENLLPWLDLTQEQTYFLIFAQSMCSKSDLLQYVVSLFEDEYLPPFLRVPDIVSNSEEFGTAYHCAVGLPMHPKVKCKVFTNEELGGYSAPYVDIPQEGDPPSLEVQT